MLFLQLYKFHAILCYSVLNVKLYTVNFKLESVYSTKTNTNMKQGDRIVHNRMFLSGDPYKGAERTAGVRATREYNNA